MERKCKNCGASFEGNKCPWCRTVYEDIPDNGYEGILLLGDERIKGYASEIEYISGDIEAYRAADGTLRRRVTRRLRKITFLET